MFKPVTAAISAAISAACKRDRYYWLVVRLVLGFQYCREIGERPVGSRCLLALTGFDPTPRVSILIPGVFIVVTVETEQFPVTAIGWIVVVVMVFVMDRELSQSFSTELAPATRTYLWIQFERLRAVTLFSLVSLASGHRDNRVLSVYACSFLRCHSRILKVPLFRIGPLYGSTRPASQLCTIINPGRPCSEDKLEKNKVRQSSLNTNVQEADRRQANASMT